MEKSILNLKKMIPKLEYESFLEKTQLNHVNYDTFFIYPSYFKELLSSLNKSSFLNIFYLLNIIDSYKEIRIEK